MADADVIDLEEAKAARMPPAHFHTIAELDGKIVIDIQGEFTVAAARLLADLISQRADAVDWRGGKG